MVIVVYGKAIHDNSCRYQSGCMSRPHIKCSYGALGLGILFHIVLCGWNRKTNIEWKDIVVPKAKGDNVQITHTV